MLIVLSIILFLLAAGTVVFYFVYMIDAAFMGHDFATTGEATLKVSQILSGYNKSSGTVYDFGSARGNFLLRLLKYSPKLKTFGIDNSGYRVWLSGLKAFFEGKSFKFIKQDVFKTDVSGADAVYIYLDQSLMPALQQKLQSELKPGSIVITNTQHLPSWPAQTYIAHLKSRNMKNYLCM